MNSHKNSIIKSFIFGTGIPLVIFILILKISRIYIMGFTSIINFFDYIKSDIFFLTGLILLFSGIILIFNKKRIHTILFIISQILISFIIIFELSAHTFFLKTGSTLDYSLILHTFLNFTDILPVISRGGSQVPYIFIMILIISILPWFLFSRFNQNREYIKSKKNLLFKFILIFTALIFFLGATSPLIIEGNTLLGKNSSINLIDTFYKHNSEKKIILPDIRKAPGKAKLIANGNIKKKNLVIILLESTRYSGTTLSDPSLKTTPYLKELSKKSLNATSAYAVVPHTSKALIAILCGIEPWITISIKETEMKSLPSKSIPQLLKEENYKTVFFQNATPRFEKRKKLVETIGFDEFYSTDDYDKAGFERCNYFGYEEDIMLKDQEEWILKNRTDPFLLTILTLSPHDDYLPLKQYGQKDFVPERKTYNRYLNSIHYLDNYVKKVIDLFKKHNLYENTIFLILGDHGEGFDEHNVKFHDNTIWNEGLHVPFIIHDPKRFQKGLVVERPINELDILPTLMNLLGYKIINAKYPGENIIFPRNNYTLYASCWYERTCMASIEGNIKYIYHYDKHPHEIYDLKSDPLEKNNIAKEYKDIDVRKEKLLKWKYEVNSMYREYYKNTRNKTDIK